MAQLALPRPIARAVDAIKRRWFERRLRSIDVEPRAGLERLGSEWGGWMIPAHEIDASWICYCVGAGGDISFDLELLRLGATVRGVDPSRRFRDEAIAEVGNNPRFGFLQYALAHTDGPLTVYRQREEGGTISAANIYRTAKADTMPGRTLPTLMAEAGDDHVDLLKIDIEGSEYSVLESLDPVSLGIRILCVEFHHTSAASRAIEIIERLQRDYVVAHLSERSDVTLVRR